ncbi:MAG: ArnT family glycosyltransferase [Candidatus Aminicenantes bacterium]
MSKSRLSVIFLLLVIAATLASAGSVYMTVVRFGNIPFPWDSGAHAYEGLRIAQDLKAGDLISFAGDTYRQGWWPFFHSWLLAPAFILFGESYTAARAVSLFCFLLFVPLLFWVCVEVTEKHGHWMGLLTAYLALTSLPLLVLSAMSMSEIPGLLMTFLTFLVYLKALKHQHSCLFVSAAVLMALTLFTKWHHGVFVVFAVLLTQFTSHKKIFSRANLSLWLPFLLIMGGWFIYPRHIISFLGHSTFQPQYYKFLTLDNWLFYPKSFFQVYHSSWIIAVVVAIGFFFSLRKIKDPRIRLLAAHVLVGIILMTIKQDNRHRYIITIVPSVWILGSSQLVEFVDYFRHRLSKSRLKISAASVMAVGMAVITLISVPRLYQSYPDDLVDFNYYSDERPHKAYEFIAGNVDRHDQVAVFSSGDEFNSLNGPTIRWHIALRRSQYSEERKNKKEKAFRYFHQLLKRRDKESFHDFVNFLEKKDIRVEEYHLLSFMNAEDKRAYQDYRENTDINPFRDKIADMDALVENISCVVVILSDREKELNHYAEQYMQAQDEWTAGAARAFSDLGMTITIYEQKKSQSLPNWIIHEFAGNNVYEAGNWDRVPNFP